MKGRKGNLQVVEGGAAPKRCPAPPAWLPPFAAAEWRRAAPDLFRRKLLADDMRATLESYCVAVGMVRDCQEALRKGGQFVTDGKGVIKAHPAAKMILGPMRELRLLAAELGLTPHRRGVKGAGEGDAAEGEADGWPDDLLR